MSVSSRVVLSVGVLMLLAVGVLGYQLWTVHRLQSINNELSDVSFVAASSYCCKWNWSRRTGALLQPVPQCGGPRTEKRIEHATLNDDHPQYRSELQASSKSLRGPGKRPTRSRHFPRPGFNTRLRSEVRQYASAKAVSKSLRQSLLDANQKTPTTDIVLPGNAVLASMAAKVKQNQSVGDQAARFRVMPPRFFSC